MNDLEINRISPVTLALCEGAMGAVLGLSLAVVAGAQAAVLGGAAADTPVGSLLGVGASTTALIVLPVIFFAFGAGAGWIQGTVLNAVARRAGLPAGTGAEAGASLETAAPEPAMTPYPESRAQVVFGERMPERTSASNRKDR
jgi:hypothetical protein